MNGIPRILALIATAKVGGPGKGLLQLMRHADPQCLELLPATFTVAGVESELAQRARAEGFEAISLPQRHSLDPAPLRYALKEICEREINVIQSHGYKGHFVAWRLSRQTGLPWIAFAHGWAEDDLKVRLYNQLERFLLRRATVAVAVSRPLFEEVAALRGLRQPTELVLNAVDPHELKRIRGGTAVREGLGVAQPHLLIGCFGRLSREKGHAHLLHALAMLGAEGERFHLVIVGDGPEQKDLRALTTRLGLAGRIHFEGYRDNMGDYFDAIDLLALPSLAEGTPNVVLEALSSGRPVLASRTGGVGDLVRNRHNGWLVEPGDRNALRAVLSELGTHPDRIAAMAEQAVSSLAPAFSPSVRLAKMEMIYRSVAPNALHGGKDIRRLG